MSIAICSMIRNEADRYLRSALVAWQEFADEIIVYDDYSDDATSDLLSDAKCILARHVQKERAWGAESQPRKSLWQAALGSRCDWLIWLDADMVPASDPRELEARDVDALAFRLYDLWDWRAPMYRVDGQWQAHANPRIWMIRNPHKGDWQWSERGIHCGHMPINYAPQRVLIAPKPYSILHYGYAEALDRPIKAAQYASQESQLSPSEILHARSIADETYVAFPLPFKSRWQLRHHAAGKPALSLVAPSVKTKKSSMPTTHLSVL